jgi:hypothetical protein
MKFDKNYWLEQLKKEVGLETVPYEELHLHFVDFSSPFGNSVEKVNAKQYVDDQLSIISSQYEEFEALSSNVHETGTNRLMYDETDIFSRLDNIAAEIPDVFYEFDNLNAAVIPDLLIAPVEQNIERTSIKYYEVFMNNRTFIVAFNLNGADVRVPDQINHLKNTSYFVEERNPYTFIGSEEIISYYQFSNLIETLLRMNNQKDISAKISNNITTTFDGAKLENFS